MIPQVDLILFYQLNFYSFFSGEMAEWLKAHDWKSCVG